MWSAAEEPFPLTNQLTQYTLPSRHERMGPLHELGTVQGTTLVLLQDAAPMADIGVDAGMGVVAALVHQHPQPPPHRCTCN
jgi:hypothetical protein